MPNIALGLPLLDYLTLTTWNTKQYEQWLKILPLVGQERRAASVMQYRGHSVGQLFVGVAEQAKGNNKRPQRHYMLRASGEIANSVDMSGDVRATRIDLQITTRLKEPFDADVLARMIDNMTWHSGRRPVTKAITSSDGLNTLYVGSRSSGRLIRFYVKQLDDGQRALRFEVEYKGKLADSVRKALLSGKPIAGFLKSDLNKGGGALLNLPLIAGFDTLLRSEEYSPSYTREESKTMQWLETQVSSTIARMLNDHDNSNKMRALIDVWRTWVDNIDESD